MILIISVMSTAREVGLAFDNSEFYRGYKKPVDRPKGWGPLSSASSLNRDGYSRVVAESHRFASETRKELREANGRENWKSARGNEDIPNRHY